MIQWRALPKTFVALSVASGIAVGCAAPDDEASEEVDSREDALVAAPLAFHGMCVGLTAIDYGSERCAPADLPDLMAFVQVADPMVHQFLATAVAGNAEIQCTSYVAPDGSTAYCADVVDRDPLGNPLQQMPGGRKNFFVAYSPNSLPHPEKPFWDAHLAGAVPPIDYRTPPVELSVAGTFNPTGAWAPKGTPPFDHLRVLKFDPRDCSGCGLYKGPGFDYLTSVGQKQVLYGWWPAFVDTSCDIETQKSGAFDTIKDAEDCRAEIVYREMSR